MIVPEPKVLTFCYFRRDLADNKVFFQHPDLMRALGIHETVMSLMVNTLNKSQQQAAAAEDAAATKRRSSIGSNSATTGQSQEEAAKVNKKLKASHAFEI